MTDSHTASSNRADTAARSRALLAYEIVDTPPENAFDDLARLAAQICHTPSAFISFLDGSRVFVKARGGTIEMQPSFEAGFCLLTVSLGKMLVIPDTLRDSRLTGIRAAGDTPVRFYAGTPIFDADGLPIGALCVADQQPRELHSEQNESLQALGRQVEALLGLRRTAVLMRQSEEDAYRSETRHRLNETRLRAVTDSLPALIAYVDAEERYLFNNLAYEEWLGIPRDQITGKKLREVLSETFYAFIAEHVKVALSGQTTTYDRELAWPDGTTRSVHGTYVPQRGQRGEIEGFAILVTDDTERRRTEDERRITAARHAALVAAQQEVARAERNIDAVLEIVANRAQDLTHADGAVVEMAEGDEMVYRAASGGAAAHVGLRLRRETSLSGRCVAEGKLLYCPDTSTDPRVDAAACRRLGICSMVVLPLTFLGRTIGVLKVYSGSPDAFPDADMPVLEMIVSLAVSAISAVSEAEARNELSLSEQRLHALVTSVPVVLFALDRNGICTQAEGKGLAALGLTSSELIGRSYKEVYAGATVLLHGVARGLAGEAGQWLSEIGDLYFETQCLPSLAEDGSVTGLIGVAFDVTERVQAEQALRQSAVRQRQFLRDVLASVTEGRLILCQSHAELPVPLASASGTISLTINGGLRNLRQMVSNACSAAGLSEERRYDIVTAVSEAGMNCIVHVGEGIGEIFFDAEAGTVQARITDHGSGISMENLPHATLKKGFTTAGSLGHGMKMMLQTADRVFLLTGPTGTRVVIEQGRIAPLPTW